MTAYYVSPFGSDANSGLSSSDPLRTLAAAEAAASGGDTINLLRDSLWRESLGESVSGLHVAAYGSGLAPVIDATDLVTSWALDGTNNYVASVAIETNAQTREPMVFEDGELLLRKTSEAAVESAAGSYFVTQSDMSASPVEVFIHPSDSGDPTTNGKSYRVTTRPFAIEGAASIDGIYCRGAGRNNGSAVAWDATTLGDVSNCEVHGGGKHHTFGQNISDTTCVDSMTETTSGSSVMFVAYMDEAAGEDCAFTNCWAIQQNGDTTASTGVAGFLAHGGSGFDNCTYTNCGVSGYIGTGWGASDNNSLATGCTALDVYTAFAANGTLFQAQSCQVRLGFGCNRSTWQATTNDIDDVFIYYPTDGTSESTSMVRYSNTLNLDNVTLYSPVPGTSTGRYMIETTDSAPTVTMNNCVLFGRPGNFYQIRVAGTDYTGDYNIFFTKSLGDNGNLFRSQYNGTTYTTLATWQSATSQDANSVYLTAAQAANFFLGDPTAGDYRINPSAVVTGGDGTTYNGTFADGTTPITDAGPQGLATVWAAAPTVRIVNTSKVSNLSLDAHYKLDETSGTDCLDSSGNGNDGTYVNSPTLGVPAPTGRGVAYDGVDQYADCPVAPAAFPLTITDWVKPTVGSDMMLFAVTDVSEANVYYGLQIDAAGDINIVRRNTTEYVTDTGVNADDGAFQHLALVLEDETTAHVYKNGVLVYTNDALDSVALAAGVDRLGIAALLIATPAQHSACVHDDVRLYSRALSPTEVYAVYSAALSQPNEFDAMAIGLSIGL